MFTGILWPHKICGYYCASNFTPSLTCSRLLWDHFIYVVLLPGSLFLFENKGLGATPSPLELRCCNCKVLCCGIQLLQPIKFHPRIATFQLWGTCSGHHPCITLAQRSFHLQQIITPYGTCNIKPQNGWTSTADLPQMQTSQKVAAFCETACIYVGCHCFDSVRSHPTKSPLIPYWKLSTSDSHKDVEYN